VLYYSLAAFERCREVETVVVVVPRGKLGTVSELCCRYRLAKVSVVVEGGKERTDSVRHGLSVLPSTGLVVVHDAARPLLTPTMLSLGFHACERHHAITFGAPATDTLKLVRGSRISQTIDRTSVIHVQTPQFFDLALLRRAHREARGHATDDCTLVEKLGRPVYWLENPDLNPKIATRADLAVCASLLRSRT
jgi:2-C-methyl-D-erythritol 4-phosphate cytidylyltransferase